jgi:hypothetical protein
LEDIYGARLQQLLAWSRTPGSKSASKAAQRLVDTLTDFLADHPGAYPLLRASQLGERPRGPLCEIVAETIHALLARLQPHTPAAQLHIPAQVTEAALLGLLPLLLSSDGPVTEVSSLLAAYMERTHGCPSSAAGRATVPTPE